VSSNIGPKQGILRVFNATTLIEIGEWQVGTYAKFCEPTIVNGRVYVSTFDNVIEVFGSMHKATPVLAWPPPAAITFGVGLGSGQLNATANVPGAFVYTPGSGVVLPVGNGQMLSVAFTPADAIDYTTVGASTTINVNPPAAPAVSVVTALTRSNGSIVVQLTVANKGGTAAANVTLASVKVGTTLATPLPQNLGAIAPGASVQASVAVPGSVGAAGAASSLAVSGTYTGGSFNSAARITLP